jgi:hypothetical protein
VELLEPVKNKNALSFCKEALNIEFTEIIGKMDASCCISSKKRDEILAKMGKRKKFSIRINKWARKQAGVLSQNEIDELLASIDGETHNRKGIPKILYKLIHIFEFKNLFCWEIIIWYKNRSYEIGFFRNKKAKTYTPYNYEYKEIKVLSEEEIYEMLTPIDDKD